jgi:aspartyl-tRNA(Asn)/glutamyl-tRNA(Gln) amidotransferase subunit C
MLESMACLPYRNCYSKNRSKHKRQTKLSFAAACRDHGRGRPAPHTQMKVTEKQVAYVADLANLELTENERSILLRDLNSILNYIDRLNQLDTTDVPPMAQVSDRYGVDQAKTGSARFAYASREDIHEGLRKSLPHEVALQNAPDSDGTFFKVPKVIER